MKTPDWWTLLLLGLAAYRLFRLISEDTIMDIPRAWLVALPFNWKPGQRIPGGYRQRLAEFLVCPWCLGFWISLALWGAWQLWPHGTLVVSGLLALSTLVGLLAQLAHDD